MALSLFKKVSKQPSPLDDLQFVLRLIESILIPLFVLSRDGTVLYWNSACEELTGLSAPSVVGTRDHWRGFYRHARPCLADLLLKGQTNEITSLYVSQNNVEESDRKSAQNWCDLPHNGRRYLAIDAVAVRNMDGVIVGVIETLQDLTSLKEAEEQLSQSNRAIEAAVIAERALVTDSIGKAVSKLAEKDLTFRMNFELPLAYKNLQTDYNYAIDQLDNAMQQVAETTNTIHFGSDELAMAADNLSHRTEQQAASLEETAAALAEITATVRSAAEGSGNASRIVAATDENAKKGAEVMGQAIDAMFAISRSAGQIGQIIGVIDEIAFQTNLLALNAGVEAARAGDAGRGFAVVASEVRALAQRSATAAKEIKGLISASAIQVDHGVKLVSETGKALEHIKAQVAEINAIVCEIAAGTRDQATGLEEVNVAVGQMDQVTQQNAAMVEQTTAAVYSLSNESKELSDFISRFKINSVHNDDNLGPPKLNILQSYKRAS